MNFLALRNVMNHNFIVVHFCLACACRMKLNDQNKNDKTERIQKVSILNLWQITVFLTFLQHLLSDTGISDCLPMIMLALSSALTLF